MTAAIVILSGVLFCAMILNLAARPKFTRNLIGICTLVSALGGLVLYGIGFGCLPGSPTLKILRTVLDVCRMYAGINDYAAVSAAPMFESYAVQAMFWLIHLMAFYATASATISTLGAAAMRKLKYWLQRYGSSVIIYGVSDDTVEFGRSLMAGGTRGIVYVGSKPDAACEAAINAAGGLVRSDFSALNPDRRFLKSLGSEKGTPELTLYALDVDGNRNQAYAAALLAALKDADVCTDRVRLVMRSADDSVESGLTRSGDRYGYGDVKNFTSTSLAARLLMQSMPPCDTMTFREDGSAEGDFDAVVVGFGKTGRNVLRYLVRNAQFVGSHFRAAVFSPAVANENGYFCNSFPVWWSSMIFSSGPPTPRAGSFMSIFAITRARFAMWWSAPAIRRGTTRLLRKSAPSLPSGTVPPRCATAPARPFPGASGPVSPCSIKMSTVPVSSVPMPRTGWP